MPLLSPQLARVEFWLGRRSVGLALLGVVAVIYTVAYVNHPLLPRMNPLVERDGWWTWFDQFTYWQSANELTHHALTAERYYYPLGYPLLGALGWKLTPAHPFFWPNLALVLATAWVSWKIWRLWLSRAGSLMVATLFTGLHAALLNLTLVVPWNTIPTQFTLLAGIWLLLTQTGGRSVAWLAGLAAVTYVVRPGDAVCFAPLLVCSVLRLSAWRERIMWGGCGVGLIAVAVVGVGLINLAVFDSWRSRYEQVSIETVGFFDHPGTMQWFWLLADGRVFFGETGTALLFRYPWMLLVIPGMIWWIKQDGASVIAALGTVMLSWGIYGSYNDFVPSGLFRYSLIHYVTWSFPLLFGLAVAGLWRGWRERPTQVAMVGTGLLAFIITGVQLEERTLAAQAAPGRVELLPETRPLWVRFPGVPLARVSELRLDGHQLQESRDYHIPYVPADLRLLLGKGTSGSQLTLAGTEVVPQVGDYVWSWRWEPARWWAPREYP
jgi:hypothetical protein